jgi:hypothetical protein
MSTMHFASVVESCYATKIESTDHKLTSGPWIYREHIGSVILAIKPSRKTFFDPGFNFEPEQVRLFTLALNIKVCYHESKLLFIMDAYFNHPSISKEIKKGLKEMGTPFPMSRKRVISELLINDINETTKVKRRFNALFKGTLKDFSLVSG